MVGIKSGGAAQGSNVGCDRALRVDRVLPGNYEFKLLKNAASVVLRSVRCHVVVTPDTRLRIGDREKVEDCEVVLGAGLPRPHANDCASTPD